MKEQFLPDVLEQEKVKTKASTELREPKRYKVLLINDDYTPMEFVVKVLKFFFHLSEEVASQVMLQVHFQGRGICGVVY